MNQASKILLLCSLVCLISPDGHTLEFVRRKIEDLKAKREAKKEEKITLTELDRLIRDARAGSLEFENYIKQIITSKFLRKLLLEEWLYNTIKKNMRANQGSIEKQITLIINGSGIPSIDKEILKIKYRFWFLEFHYALVGKHIFEGLIQREKAIVDAFDSLDPDISEIERMSLTTAIGSVLQEKAAENFNTIGTYLDFTKQAHINYENLRKHILQKLMANFQSKTLRDFINRLLEYLEKRFFTRKKTSSLFRKEETKPLLTTGEIKTNLTRQLKSYPAYTQKDAAIQKTIRTTMLQYVPIYLINKHVMPFLNKLLNNFLNRQYLNEHFLKIEEAIDGRSYQQLFKRFIDSLRLTLAPEPEQLLYWEERKIEQFRQQEAIRRAGEFEKVKKSQKTGAKPQKQQQQPPQQRQQPFAQPVQPLPLGR